MAGTARPGASATTVVDKTMFMPGMSRGTIPFSQWQNGFPQVVAQTTQSGAGPYTAVAKSATPKVPVARPGLFELEMTPAGDFFEKVHILPRLKIEFGSILSLEEEEYEVYNAYRTTDLTLSLITNNVTPGVELPNVSTPSALPRLSSIVDPSTTDNSGGTSLGTIVKTKVQALATGLASFDGDVIFNFTSGDTVFLLVSGSRVVLFPFEYEDMSETLSFLTDIIEAFNGKEQRISLRDNPRQEFQVLYKLSGNDRQRAQVLLMDWMANTFGFPLWNEDIKLTSSVSIGATAYPVSGADTVDFRDGGFALVYTDANTYDVINIVGLTASQITAGDPSLFAYPAGTPIMPLRLARIRQAVQADRYPVNLEQFNILWESVDNDTGALTGDTSAFSSYNGRVLLDDCNVIEGSMSENYLRRMFVVDNQVGAVSVVSPWDRFKRVASKGFVARSRTEILQLRRLMLALRGKQKSFYIPTFFDDVEPKAGISSGTDTMDIVNIEYTRFAQSRDPKNLIKVTFTDGTSVEREILSSTKVDATTERLTVDTNWSSSKTVDEIDRVEFYELVRLDTDKVRIDYPRAALARVQVPVKAVFDDI